MNPKILEKIKHCLALSKSSNEHEAATALRQAHALMQKYGLSEDDITALEIEMAGGQTIVAMKPPLYQLALAQVIAEVFGCRPVAKVVMIKGSLKQAVHFVGFGSSAEIATYAYDVLFRQVQTARKTYTKNELSRVRLAKNKTARADIFCQGFVGQVYELVGNLIVKDEQKQAHLQNYLEQNTSETPLKARKTKLNATNASDFINGAEQGKNAQLHTAVYGQTAPLAIGGGQ